MSSKNVVQADHKSALLVAVALARHSRQGDESHSEEETRKNKEEEEAIV
jgi:hypothetical protein